jgi:hypothetical protein
MTLLEKLMDIKGVKNVKKRDSGLRINLHTKPTGSDAEKILGNLNKISQNIRNTLDDSEEISGWEWTVRPQKRYTETSLGGKVSDRKEKGHRPAYYQLTVQS